VTAAVHPLGIGIIGFGFMGRTHAAGYCAAFAAGLPVAVKAVTGPPGVEIPEGAARLADAAAILAREDIGAVSICTYTDSHVELGLAALAAGKHVLVEKPAFPTMEGYRAALEARNRARRVVLIGENDHYKPLAVRLRTLLTDGVIGEFVFAHFATIARRLKTADDWRNDEKLAGGDAFFEEGIHWLHLAGSLGPRIVSAHGYRPTPSREGPDTRVKSMMVAFEYDTGAVGSLYYSREVPSLLRGLRLSKLFGRQGVISFESNGTIMVVRGSGAPRLVFPGFRDIRGYRAMYRDFHRAILTGAAPEMSLERAMDDQRLMDQIYASLAPAGPMAVAR
jgi:predicted dehydrogenase